jgi:DNA-binding NtrC family response regulator
MKPRILIADDESMIVDTLRLILGVDYELSNVGTGREVYCLLTSCRGLYKLAIVDLNMPEWNGHSSVELAKALGSEIPVIYISGYLMDEFNESGIIFLQKPFTAEELQDKVKRILGLNNESTGC